MSRVAELWCQLTTDEQDNLAHAARGVLAERGTELVVAIAREARLYTSGSIALERAEAAITGGTYPALGPRCHDCDQPATEPLLQRWDYDTSTLLELCKGCYLARVPARIPADVPGDTLQAFPAPMPVREEP